MPADVSILVVIAVGASTDAKGIDDEKRNLWLQLQRFRPHLSELRLVVVEPLKSSGSTFAEMCDASCEHLTVATEGPSWPRPALVDHAVATCATPSTQRVWVHDVDVLVDVGEVLAQLKNTQAAVVSPCRRLTSLAKADTDALGRGEHLSVTPTDIAFGKGGLVVDIGVWQAFGGWHPELSGEGDPAFEWVSRARTLGSDEGVLDVEGHKLHRRKTDVQRQQQRHSKQLREALCTQHAADIATVLQTRLGVDVARAADVGRQLRKAAAWRRTSTWTPPTKRAALPGTMWGITTHFNPAGYANKKQNYDRFLQGMRRQGLPVLTVEQVSVDAGPELSSDDPSYPVVHVEDGDVLWQKERLLNVALDHLPNVCDKVVWLDADVLFSNDSWVHQTAERLEHVVVVQPFSRCVRLLPDEDHVDIDALPLGNGDHEVLHSIAYGMWAKGPDVLDGYLRHGHSGYAWAARRSLLQAHGLYDANILGNADLNIAHAFLAGPDVIHSDRLSAKANAHLQRWARGVFDEVNGSVGFTEGTVFHLWHGSKEDRRYHERLTVLQEHDYDPDVDLRVGPSGAYVWASSKPGLHAWCVDYFHQRREDALPDVADP